VLERLEGNLRFTPLLAESVKPSADFKTYTVKLRAAASSSTTATSSRPTTSRGTRSTTGSRSPSAWR